MLTARCLLTYDPTAHHVRLGRLVWSRGTVGDGQGYSAMLSLGFVSHLIGWSRTWHAWRLTFCGVTLHYQRSYGGSYV